MALLRTTYAYRPLEEVSRQIRLLLLQPPRPGSSSNDPLHASVLDSDISSDDLSYVALSYTWGTEEASRELVLDGYRISIRPNLEAALRAYQRAQTRALAPDGIRTPIWVDAICINQGDVFERNAQVGIMRRIYEKADSVLVWLGEEEINSALAMNDDNVELDGEPLSVLLDATINLLHRPWWTRTWIVQELALARQVHLMCGQSTFSWNTLFDHILRIASHIAENQLDLDARACRVFVVFFTLWNFRLYTNVRQSGRSTYENRYLVALMHQLRLWKSTDPRDRVYGLLGLSEDIADGALTPDYNVPTQEVYHRVAQHSIDTLGTYAVLAFANPEHRGLGFPSWVPDWSSDRVVVPLPRCTEALRSRFNAAGGSCIDITFSADGSAFTFTGAVLTRVEALLNLDELDKSFLPFLEDEVIANIYLSSSYPDHRHTFRHTIVADANADGHRLDVASAKELSMWFDRTRRRVNAFIAGDEATYTALSLYSTPKQWSLQQFDIAPDALDYASPVAAPERLTRRQRLEENHSEEESKSFVSRPAKQVCDISSSFEPILSRLQAVYNSIDTSALRRTCAYDDAKITEHLVAHLQGRALLLDEKQRLGIASAYARPKDLICIPTGGHVPWILRPIEAGEFEFVGECYIDGIMDGQLAAEVVQNAQRMTLR